MRITRDTHSLYYFVHAADVQAAEIVGSAGSTGGHYVRRPSEESTLSMRSRVLGGKR